MKNAKTHVTSVRVDMRSFATIYAYFLENNIDSIRNSRGKTISLAFRYFERLVIDKRPDLEFTSHQDAMVYLEKEGVLNMKSKFSGKSSILKELQKESIIYDSDPNISAKGQIDKRRKDLPFGIDSFQQLYDIEADLEKRTAELEPETIEEASKRRDEADKLMNEGFEKLSKGE